MTTPPHSPECTQARDALVRARSAYRQAWDAYDHAYASRTKAQNDCPACREART